MSERMLWEDVGEVATPIAAELVERDLRQFSERVAKMHDEAHAARFSDHTLTWNRVREIADAIAAAGRDLRRIADVLEVRTAETRERGHLQDASWQDLMREHGLGRAVVPYEGQRRRPIPIRYQTTTAAPGAAETAEVITHG